MWVGCGEDRESSSGGLEGAGGLGCRAEPLIRAAAAVFWLTLVLGGPGDLNYPRGIGQLCISFFSLSFFFFFCTVLLFKKKGHLKAVVCSRNLLGITSGWKNKPNQWSVPF